MNPKISVTLENSMVLGARAAYDALNPDPNWVCPHCGVEWHKDEYGYQGDHMTVDNPKSASGRRCLECAYTDATPNEYRAFISERNERVSSFLEFWLSQGSLSPSTELARVFVLLFNDDPAYFAALARDWCVWGDSEVHNSWLDWIAERR